MAMTDPDTCHRPVRRQEAGVVATVVKVDDAVHRSAGMVECTEFDGGMHATRRNIGSGQERARRPPRRLAVMVSVPTAVWEDWTASCDRVGRPVTDHGGAVTVWATRDDLNALLRRWPDGHMESYRAAVAATRDAFDEVEIEWMGAAARSALMGDT